MREVFKQLASIHEVGKRLDHLSKGRGVPDTQRETYSNDSKSLLWAYEELRKRLLANTIVVVGKKELLARIPGIQVTDGPVGSCVIIEPEKFKDEKLRSFFTEIGPLDGECPDWLNCSKYFVFRMGGDTGSSDSVESAILFDCALVREWLNDVGLKDAETQIREWAKKQYSLLHSQQGD